MVDSSIVKLDTYLVKVGDKKRVIVTDMSDSDILAIFNDTETKSEVGGFLFEADTMSGDLPTKLSEKVKEKSGFIYIIG